MSSASELPAWLLASPAPEPVIEEHPRDFSEEPIGSRVRFDHRIREIEACPLCGRAAVRIVTPRWKHVPERHQFIHAAMVSRVGYGVLDSCHRQIIPTKRRRTR